MNLLQELRYRNVFRVAAAYAVVGWLLAQVADLVVDAFNLPDAFLQMVIIFLVLGFPVALFFAWVFELTPEGFKREAEIDHTAAESRAVRIRAARVPSRATVVMRENP